MRPLRSFDEFLTLGIVRKTFCDKLRAKSLVEEATKRELFLSELGKKLNLSDSNANYFIEASYDILIELIRAKLFSDGFNVSAQGNHEAEVTYLQKLGFLESEVRFMNDLRYFRNGILYYGKSYGSEYGKNVLGFLNSMYPQLKKLFGDVKHEQIHS